MIDTEHSPGPWTFHGPKANIHVCQESNPDMRVCFMTSDGPTAENARLISAAPDMLQVLLEFVSCFQTVPGSIGDEVKEDAFKAIAKAVGRDPRS